MVWRPLPGQQERRVRRLFAELLLLRDGVIEAGKSIGVREHPCQSMARTMIGFRAPWKGAFSWRVRIPRNSCRFG